jgi:DNA-binding MarR family transcriptional regulator
VQVTETSALGQQADSQAVGSTPRQAGASTPDAGPTPRPSATSTQPSAAGTQPAQAGTQPSATSTQTGTLAADLYALVVFLHKNCNADFFEAMSALELTMTQLKLLHHLDGIEQPLTLKDAAERLPLSLPAASRTVEDLVQRGMIERHEDVDDRRMKRISLTDTGSAVIRRLNAARLSGLDLFTQTLTDDERGALAGALAQLLLRPDVAVCRPEGTPASD